MKLFRNGKCNLPIIRFQTRVYVHLPSSGLAHPLESALLVLTQTFGTNMRDYYLILLWLGSNIISKDGSQREGMAEGEAKLSRAAKDYGHMRCLLGFVYG